MTMFEKFVLRTLVRLLMTTSQAPGVMLYPKDRAVLADIEAALKRDADGEEV